MKRKIIGIFVCTLLIGAIGVALADWEEGDGHKMHWPQLPDPYGWDVDFGMWRLGDDWMCTETGPVSDIHFWISWYKDEVQNISSIDVSIWSNNPDPPYSRPDEKLWSRTFHAAEFVIAGPWEGRQGWLWPYCEYLPDNHNLYYQVNIKCIEEPFEQEKGEIYWLVIGMPFNQDMVVGWKTTKEDLHFKDYAVWEPQPDYWQPICAQVDLAFVITGEPKADLCCKGSLSWTNVKPGATVTGTFQVGNCGETCSMLNWNITGWPTWGTWTFTPSSGTGLTPAMGWINVDVAVVAPDDPNTEFTGEVKVVNSDDPSDFCIISVYLKTPVNNQQSSQQSTFPLFLQILERLLNIK